MSKRLPDEYMSVFEHALNNDCQISENILNAEKKIMGTLEAGATEFQSAKRLFQTFAYLHYVQEFLTSAEPLASVDITSLRKQGKYLCARLIVPENARYSVNAKISPERSIGIKHVDVMEQLVLTVKKVSRTGNEIVAITSKPRTVELLKRLEGKTCELYVLPSNTHLNSFNAACDRMRENPELVEKLFPNGAFPRGNPPQNVNNFTRPMNEMQEVAVDAILDDISSTFVLFGPPGTGKTYTLVEAVVQLVERGNHVLICTPSNMAADVFAEMLLAVDKLDARKILRLMSPTRDVSEMSPKLEIVTRRQLREDANGNLVAESYVVPQNWELQVMDVVICTLGTCHRLEQLPKGHFSHIIVDEAAQAAEMDTWIPLGLLATESTRLILAGDPKQLGPVTTVQTLGNYGYKQSLLMRLYLIEEFRRNPRCLVQLRHNHRSHEKIVEFTSFSAYCGTLCATNPEGHDSLCKTPVLPTPDFPILFHAVNGIDEISRHKSYRNRLEAKIVLQYVRELQRLGVPAKDIGVISPYAYQVETIQSELRESEADLTVASVERFQGSERRVIIISTVRTSPAKLGFVDDDFRTNTAITRARQLLIVVGCQDALEDKGSWGEFIRFCNEHNAVVQNDGDEERLNHHRLAQMMMKHMFR